MKTTAAILSFALLCACGTKTETGKDKAGETKSTETTESAPEGTVTTAVGDKKYSIKSGIVTFENKMEMDGISMETTKILYFDDFGAKECEEEYKKDANGKLKLSSRNFEKDGSRYTCSVENGGGAITKGMGYGVAARFNMDEAAMMTDNNFKKVADETVAGKTCTGFSMETPSGIITMHGWNGIAMKTVVVDPASKTKASIWATKVEENVAIPADKFEVPAGVKMTEM